MQIQQRSLEGVAQSTTGLETLGVPVGSLGFGHHHGGLMSQLLWLDLQHVLLPPVGEACQPGGDALSRDFSQACKQGMQSLVAAASVCGKSLNGLVKCQGRW